MTKYVDNRRKERDPDPHPVWRGIGLVMMVLIPILSFAISDQLMIYMNENNMRIIEQLMAPPVEVPLWGVVYNWPAMLTFTFVISLIMFGFFAVINAMIYSTSSNKTLRTLESAPKRFKRKRNLKKPRYD